MSQSGYLWALGLSLPSCGLHHIRKPCVLFILDVNCDRFLLFDSHQGGTSTDLDLDLDLDLDPDLGF